MLLIIKLLLVGILRVVTDAIQKFSVTLCMETNQVPLRTVTLHRPVDSRSLPTSSSTRFLCHLCHHEQRYQGPLVRQRHRYQAVW